MAAVPPARIIIIEDDEGVARLQQKRLERVGHEVVTFSTPQAAIPTIQRGELDLMILDYRLPDNRTGLEFYDELKQSGYDVPAILVTGFTNEALIVKALRAGLKDFVSKSVEYLDYLPEAVARVLHQTRMERRLAETEERFKTVFHASPIAIAVATIDEGRLVDVNQAFLKLYGYTRQEVLGRTLRELGIAESVITSAELGRRLQQVGLLRDVRFTTFDRSGRQIEIEASLEVINLEGRQCLLAMIRDVSKRLRAEAALRESENRFQAFMKHTPAMTFLKDRDGRYVYVNQSLLREFSSEPADWLGRTDADLFSPQQAEKFRTDDELVRTQRRTIELEEQIDHPASGDRSWLTLKFPVDDGAENLYVGGVTIDITERRRAAQQLELQQRAMNATSEGIVITDPKQPGNPIVHVNHAFEQLTGYTSEEALGNNCRFLQGPETDQETAKKIGEAIRQQRPITVEILNYRKDGTTFWNLLSITPVRDAAGQMTHFVGVQRDVTERKILAEQMRQAQKMEAIGRLAGGVAHDFNNLLTIILGNAELALEDLPQGDSRRPLVQEIAHAGQRAASLTTQLLAFSRKQVLEPKVVNLNDLVSDTERLLRRLIGEDIYLTTVLDPHLQRVKVDPVQIEQILLNLTVNARDAMPHGGKLIIETHNAELDGEYSAYGGEVRAGRYVMLAVTDTGHGMTEATQARIFEPFFTTKERGKGTGMGLPTVYGIVQQSGGYIWVYSEVGRGTTFKLYFPEHVHEGTSAPPPAPQRSRLGGSETLLLVEDEAMVRALAKRILETQGYRVLEGRNGAEALRVAEAHPETIHLLVTDVVMPGMSGKQLAEQLTALRPDLRVLFVSGYTDNTITEHGVLDPHVAFLQKPFTNDSLLSKIRLVLDRPPGVEAARV